MAGDWIKVEHATIDKPEVLQIADLCEISADDALGKLIRVWVWFDVQSRDGNAGSVTGTTLKRFIDRLVARPGFAACMQKVGWLNDSGIPNFDRHNGESSKKRALTAERVKRSRNASIVTEALPEKRREEKINTNTRKRSKATALPEDFRITDRVLKWAAAHGHSGTLELHFEAFISTCKAKGYTYVDWDEALINAVRKNWAGITPKAGEARRLAI